MTIAHIGRIACILILSCTLEATQLREKWIVITTINYPTATLGGITKKIRCLSCLNEWQIVVVADKKTPADWQFPGVIFLDIEQQEALNYNISKLLPWNHYSRKNIGYLYAIQHGAQLIYETDDDNFLIDGQLNPLPEYAPCNLYETNALVVNPYAYFGKPTVWPRGYPLKEITKTPCTTFTEGKQLFVPIQQGVVNDDPDVDAIFRLTRNEMITFTNATPVALPVGTFCPFNSQNTIFYQSAFWALLMPMTTSFRVADIWRGYWTQRLLWDINARLCFLPANAYQERNAHDFMKDFEQELDLYLKTDDLLNALKNWNSSADNLFDRMHELIAYLVEKNFFEAADLALTDAWIADLRAVGYMPPAITFTSFYQ